MTKKEKALTINSELSRLYPEAACSLTYTNPLELIIATVLSAQCTDARVNIVSRDLFARYRTAEDFAGADPDELMEIIKPCGFYKNKAKNIQGLCRGVLERFGGELPGTMDELLTLPGVGRKTANLVLGTVFNDPGIVADTHCIRLSNRFGLCTSEDPVKVEQQLTALIPKPERLVFCHRLIYHGRAVCTARSPKCGECTLAALCSYKHKNLT
mgnify:FL=1